jgi:thioredoxin reductase (NADPH)
VIEGFAWGGLLQQTTDVENYPGFPEGIMGPEMMQKFRDQAERFGARLLTDEADRVELASEPGGVHSVWVGDTEYRARTVILAMGAEHKKLGVPGELELAGRGRQLLRDLRRRVLPRRADGDRRRRRLGDGGGDLPVEVRQQGDDRAPRDEFRASKIMLERARAQPEHRVADALRVEEFVAGENGALGHARSRTPRPARSASSRGLGRVHRDRPRAAVELVAGQIDVDENGYVVTEGKSTRTNRPGVFAAGDLVDHTYRQAITAAGSGCQAALDAEWYLRADDGAPDLSAGRCGHGRSRVLACLRRAGDGADGGGAGDGEHDQSCAEDEHQAPERGVVHTQLIGALARLG